jgi:hypothetical protein
MPMIDIYAPAGIFPDVHRLASDAAAAVMEIEGLQLMQVWRCDRCVRAPADPPLNNGRFKHSTALSLVTSIWHHGSTEVGDAPIQDMAIRRVSHCARTVRASFRLNVRAADLMS